MYPLACKALTNAAPVSYEFLTLQKPALLSNEKNCRYELFALNFPCRCLKYLLLQEIMKIIYMYICGGFKCFQKVLLKILVRNLSKHQNLFWNTDLIGSRTFQHIVICESLWINNIVKYIKPH